MIKVDLITGFLGSGKTTFIKKYAKYYMDKGQKVGILENDYGAVNVDMLLLNELRGENCELEMVAGACDADCHRRRFKTKLISMGMCGYDRVIIEPSGIFDMDEFFDSLHDEPLDRWYEIGNVITIVDAKLEDSLSKDSEYYLASQLANAGLIVLSRTQLASASEVASTKAHMLRAAESAKLNLALDNVFEKNWDELDSSDYLTLEGCGYKKLSYVKLVNKNDVDYSTMYFMELSITKDTLSEKIDALMKDSIYGHIVRVKGFFSENSQWYQVNATKKETLIEKISVGQEVFIVIGENLNKELIEKLFDQPDIEVEHLVPDAKGITKKRDTGKPVSLLLS